MNSKKLPSTKILQNITILCKIIDNYGDIGFVFRLSKAITALKPDIQLRLIVSDLSAFSRLAPEINTSSSIQIYNNWQVFDWNNAVLCKEYFIKEIPDTILECFQCGRPEWLDDVLFKIKKDEKIVQIINIDYLTAEPYAEDFHCLQSATRSISVQKINFMPGFSNKTGGLILDYPFIKYAASNYSFPKLSKKNLMLHEEALKEIQPYFDENFPSSLFSDENCFRVMFFSYKQNFTPIIQALSHLQEEKRLIQPSFKVHVFVAADKYSELFVTECENISPPFTITKIPFLPQQPWDALLCLMSYNFVRGEDSLSRACLTGIPFIWHAYFQTDNYQLIKVSALLDKIKPFFSTSNFNLIQSAWLDYNNESRKKDTLEKNLFNMFLQNNELRLGFSKFARSLINVGDFTEHLLNFL